jgi:hypothetical protein
MAARKSGPVARTEKRRAEIMEALKAGKKQADIAREFKVTRQAVSYLAKQLVETDTARALISDTPEDELVSSDREWLAKVRDDPNAPTSERVKCGIALARMSAAERKVDDWTPPSGPEFAECLAVAILELGDDQARRVASVLAEGSPALRTDSSLTQEGAKV